MNSPWQRAAALMEAASGGMISSRERAALKKEFLNEAPRTEEQERLYRQDEYDGDTYSLDVNENRKYRKVPAPPPPRPDDGSVLRFDGDFVRDPDGSLRLIQKNRRYEKR